MVRLAVISDIHGNYKALEAFLKDMEKDRPDGMICLGDYVTDGPYPRRTLDMLYDLKERFVCHMVRGNREQYLIDDFHSPQGWRPSSASGALYYTAENISLEDMAFFESLPETMELHLEGLPGLTLCHGVPGRIRGNMREEPETRETCMRELQTPYLLGGHSHHQERSGLYGRTYINPGSLGLAIDGRGCMAQYAVLQGDRGDWTVSLRSIPYDVEAYLQDFTASGLDEYGMILNRALKKTLLTGRNYFYDTIVEASRLNGKSVDDVSEETWIQAAERLGL